MDLHDLIVSDPGLMGGEPCFRGTRVPVATLFDNLADGVGLEEILVEWPSLNRADVVAVLLWPASSSPRGGLNRAHPDRRVPADALPHLVPRSHRRDGRVPGLEGRAQWRPARPRCRSRLRGAADGRQA